jgi:hypothetical protein
VDGGGVIVVAVAELAVLLLVVAGFLWFLRDERERNAQVLADQALLFEQERSELLTRIQHPQLVPMRRGGAAAARQSRSTDAKALAQVGTFAPRPDGDAA